MSSQEQIKRKGGGGFNAGGGSAFGPKEEIEFPEIGGIMDQIETNLNRTRGVVVQDKELPMRRDNCNC